MNVDVFQFDEAESPPCLFPCRRSDRTHPETMHILLYKNRFCYITNINKAGHAFGCLTCGKLWTKEYMMHRHEKTCTGDKIKHIYPGGVYQPAPTASELLEANGISVDTHYIFLTEPPLTLKCFFETENLPQLKTPHPRTTYTAKHIPLSVSTCSNVPLLKKKKNLLHQQRKPSAPRGSDDRLPGEHFKSCLLPHERRISRCF